MSFASIASAVAFSQLAEAGLDLFDKGGSYNFPTLIFYQTGYNLFTMRQASRRAWRIGQRRDCKVIYLYYGGTLQARAMALMKQPKHWKASSPPKA